MTPRERIEAATLALIEERGFGAVSIAAVARDARVARQTVYSTFGGRERLVSEVLARVALAALEEVRAELEGVTAPAAYLARFVVAGRREVRRRPALRALLLAETGNPLFDPGAVDRGREVVRPLLGELLEREPGLRDSPVLDRLLEALVRLGISVVVLGSSALDDDDDLRRFLEPLFAAALASDDAN